MEALGNREADGENLICFPHAAERSLVICMIKKLDRLLINWILNSNQILHEVIIETPQSLACYILHIHPVSFIFCGCCLP